MSALSNLTRLSLGAVCFGASRSTVPLLSKIYCQRLSTLSLNGKCAIAKHFVNRNPRNLEFMGIAWRRIGWKFQYPPRDFYHRIIFERSNRQTTAYVEHCSGKIVISASTKELAIARHLHSTTDICAAISIGRVLAQRCQESGITAAVLHAEDNNEKSEKFQSFQKALIDEGVQLQEPEEVVPDYEPGIDYSNEEEVSDLYRRQWLVHELGTKSKTTKTLNLKRKLRGRRRPWPTPKPFEAPSYTFT